MFVLRMSMALFMDLKSRQHENRTGFVSDSDKKESASLDKRGALCYDGNIIRQKKGMKNYES